MRWRRISSGLAAVTVGAVLGVGLGPPAPAGATAGAAAGAPGPAAAAVDTGGGWLNIRDNASTWNPPTGRVTDGAGVRPVCQLDGESVAGRVRDTSLWLHLGDGRYVSGAYVAWPGTRPDLGWCDQPADPAPGSRTGFVEWAAGHAAPSRQQYRVPVSVTVAQAINESGWGSSALTTQGNSYFGIKCFGIPGPVATGCRPYGTTECDDTGCGPTVATFRVYRSAASSFLDHGRFLTVNPRYQPAFAHTGDPDRFAREIHKAGYATDPRYSDKLIALMRQHDLYRFD